MMVLRFRDRTPREFKVPLNLKVGGVELPIGLGIVFLLGGWLLERVRRNLISQMQDQPQQEPA